MPVVYRALGLSVASWAAVQLLKPDEEPPSESVSQLQRAHELSPRSVVLQYRLGCALLRVAGQQRTGLNHLLAAAKLNPKHAGVFAALGAAYIQLDPVRARKCYERSLALQPLNEVAGRALLQLYLEQGQTEQAIALLQRMASVPGAERLAFVWRHLGVYQLHQRDSAAAIRSLQIALRATSADSAEVWWLLGQAYHQRGSLTSALKALDRCCSLDPKHVDALTLRAQVRHRLAQYTEALAGFREALGLQAQHPVAAVGLVEASYDLARRHLQCGMYGPALGAVDEALQVLAGMLRALGQLPSLLKLAGDLCLLPLLLPRSLRQEFHHLPTLAAALQVQQASLQQCAVRAFALLAQKNTAVSAWIDLSAALCTSGLEAQRQAQAHARDKDLRAALSAAELAVSRDPQSASAWNMCGLVAGLSKVGKH